MLLAFVFVVVGEMEGFLGDALDSFAFDDEEGKVLHVDDEVMAEGMGDSLNFDITTPSGGLRHFVNVFIEVFVEDEVLEEVLLQFQLIDCNGTVVVMLRFVPFELVGDRSEEAVAVTDDIADTELRRC